MKLCRSLNSFQTFHKHTHTHTLGWFCWIIWMFSVVLWDLWVTPLIIPWQMIQPHPASKTQNVESLGYVMKWWSKLIRKNSTSFIFGTLSPPPRKTKTNLQFPMYALQRRNYSLQVLTSPQNIKGKRKRVGIFKKDIVRFIASPV